ncbi:agamous-like MADS-box protein AGL80 [Abrus precatorius]|uniref:Agamous-like MADS-box protein AGL80 n=1 Tax=Abrus precatorius TaxID=3816 RepID=A0A8B8KK95_ABRPR|nr:agamous-like MADS-box protein AGL80 [Abrus precatorius]
MGRGRISMELIQKEKARKTTFQKRKSGLMKKVYEFSTLCGVDVCVIIYAPMFDGQGLAEPETWPQDTKEVHRIIQKYHNTTSDRRPKMYDVQEYYKDRMKKVESEISKVCKEKLKIMYPTWDESFNALGEEQLRMFVSMLDVKLDACNQRMNMLEGDLKGKAIAESDKVETLVPYLASSPSSHLNLMQNTSQAQNFPLPVKSISDNNHLALYPFQLSQSSQSSMLHFGQNCMQLMGKNEMVDWADQVGAVTYDPKTGMLKENGAANNQNSLPCYYNGNVQTMQPYTIALQTLPSHSQYEAPFQIPSDPPPGFQLNGLYDSNMLQAQMFTYMHGGK